MSEETTATARTLKPTDLVIRVNNILTNDPCALCAAPTDPTGIDLFRADTFALVCHACGLLHAPALVRLLNLASAANTFVRAEYEMSGIATDEKPL
jgi:hypothetical protein